MNTANQGTKDILKEPEINCENSAILPLDALIRSVGINRTTPHTVFLGAGASVSSGVPSAQMCIWEWKRSIFLTRNPGLEEQFSELSLAGVRKNIQRWLDREGSYPPEGSSEEYSFYIEACFPIAGDRQAFFREKVRKAQPHIGYKMLCHLAEMDVVRSAWTTNFDGLVARCAAGFEVTPFEVGIDSQLRLPSQVRRGALLCVSLHGDYRYDPLKNAAHEVQEQESALSASLAAMLKDAPCIVSGYSGRDASVMQTLQDACAQPGTGPLYWCGYEEAGMTEPVKELIDNVGRAGRPAHYVPSLGFDDLMVRLALHCCDDERLSAVRSAVSKLSVESSKKREVFAVPDYPAETLIKSNAFEIDCPAEVLEFELHEWPAEGVWAWLREKTARRPLAAVPFRGRVMALGTVQGIADCFGDNVKGPIRRTPVGVRDLQYEDGAVVSLMRQALVMALAEAKGLATDGRSELYADPPIDQIRQGDEKFVIQESVIVFLRRIGGRQYALLKPSIWISASSGGEVPEDVVRDAKLRILGSQYNAKFNQAMGRWRKRLLSATDSAAVFEFPSKCGSTFKFKVRRSPIFASIGTAGRRSPISIPPTCTPLVRHGGFHLSEPQLLFSSSDGTRQAKDTHPIRGILDNRPFDFPLTQKGLITGVRLGVICPRAETHILHNYLQQANAQHCAGRYNPEYLLDYPGFQKAYGLPLDIPYPDSAGWVTCSEPDDGSPQTAAVGLAQNVNRAIEALEASYSPNIVLILFPDRWAHLRGYQTDTEKFDLHDFVKAFCVQRGIATQFLSQETISKTHQCDVWWWLSLAMYVKSMRTPWVLDALDEDTAYVGLGFSVDPTAARGTHVVLGCSHIYSAKGEGLQYRLSAVENPIFRGKNPFMSTDDARRTGDTIRHLFYESRSKLPGRVVIHKRTPFIREEREGLCEGLSGVTNVEMVEIQTDRALRYVASMQKNGGFDEDNFPVRRGTTVKLDNFTALVWVHGVTSSLNTSRRYYQGKRRIPAPVTVKRHVGCADLRVIAEEILGLSKMNWNTFDLYTKLPATIHSSGEIARIGSLLKRFGAQSYDFRLFI